VHDARELNKHSIAGRLDDAAAMRRDGGIDEFAAVRLERCQGADLVGSHQPGVSGDVGRQDCHQSPFYASTCHGPRSLSAALAMPSKHGDRPLPIVWTASLAAIDVRAVWRLSENKKGAVCTAPF